MTMIIAELGVNHNGDLDTALRMIDAAARAGADAVKVQTYVATEMVTADAPKAAYQKAGTDGGISHLEMLRQYELDRQGHLVLKSRAESAGLRFLASPFDLKSVDLLMELKIFPFKIPSGEITNLPYLRRIAAAGREVILSSGMATLEEVITAVNSLIEGGTRAEQITVLQCTTSYPADFADVNLKAMQTIARACQVSVGFSDHTPGIEASVAAVAMGAKVIEKHLTLDKTLPGPDHIASLDPEEFAALVRAVRNVEKALGTGEKKPSAVEIPMIAVARKSIVASRPIRKGEIFTPENLTVKRPGTGLSPMKWDALMGQTAGRNYRRDEGINP